MYFSKKELDLQKKYLKDGYIILPVANKKAYEKIVSIVTSSVKDTLKKNINFSFDNIHKNISEENLNNFRVKIISKINSHINFKRFLFLTCKPYIDIIVGNELVMQKNINLSIQYPNDSSSLLDVHSDTWAGDSSYEVVVWLPLVNCYKTKSMYIMNRNLSEKYAKKLFIQKNTSSDSLFHKIKKNIKWLKINKGQILIFNQNLIHGNHINKEMTTRWSFNCRFKAIFTPYSEKKIGDYFIPITMRPATKDGMHFKLPKIDIK